MSIEESLGAIPITLVYDSFDFIHDESLLLRTGRQSASFGYLPDLLFGFQPAY
jgi:hypothetical protein